MGRVFITIIVPLLLPTALYVLWRALPGRHVAIRVAWAWLIVAGLALASLTLVVLSVDFGAPTDGRYVPPHLQDGAIVPGHFEDAPARSGSQR